LNSNTHLYPVECRGINILTRRPVPTNKRKRDTYEFEGTRCIERIILRNRYDTLRLLEWILKTLRRILESFYEILRKNVEDFVLVLLDNLLIKDVIEIVLEQDDHDVISHLTMIVRCIMLNERFSTNISRSLRKDFNKASATYIDVLKDSRMYNCENGLVCNYTLKDLIRITHEQLSREWKLMNCYVDINDCFLIDRRLRYVKHHELLMQYIGLSVWQEKYNLKVLDKEFVYLQRSHTAANDSFSSGTSDPCSIENIIIRMYDCGSFDSGLQYINDSKYLPTIKYLKTIWIECVKLFVNIEVSSLIELVQKFCTKLNVDYPYLQRTLLIKINNNQETPIHLCILWNHNGYRLIYPRIYSLNILPLQSNDHAPHLERMHNISLRIRNYLLR
jgi:hypothetical protein